MHYDTTGGTMTTTTITGPDDEAALPTVGDTLRLTDGTTARVLGAYDATLSRVLIGQDHAWQVTGPTGARVIGLTDIVAPQPGARCSECAGLNGAHGYVHVRHEQGGGGWNRPCSRIVTPEPATDDEQTAGATRVPVEIPGTDPDHVVARVLNAAINWENATQNATSLATMIEAGDALHAAVRAYIPLVTK
jgi:hypothetical protein